MELEQKLGYMVAFIAGDVSAETIPYLPDD